MSEKRSYLTWFGLFAYVFVMAGCTGTKAFTTSARPGETIALAAGWKQQMTRSDLTVVITPQSGDAVTYNPGDSRVRTIVQGYPDPVSKLLVSDRSGVTYPDAGLPNAGTASGYNLLPPSFGNIVRSATNEENDWSETIVFLDLPSALAPGQATVALKIAGLNVMTPAEIEILPLAAGSKNNFSMSNFYGIGALIRSAERAPHFVIRFSGPEGVIPHSIQADFLRTLADSGTAWVTHPRGDIQGILWSDTGSLIKVMLSPVKGQTVDRLSDFKFYVTGAVTALTVNSIKAYDTTGNLIPGFSANLQFVNN